MSRLKAATYKARPTKPRHTKIVIDMRESSGFFTSGKKSGGRSGCATGGGIAVRGRMQLGGGRRGRDRYLRRVLIGEQSCCRPSGHINAQKPESRLRGMKT